VPAIISYGVNLPALLRPGRPLTDSELVATWAVQKSARDAEVAAEDQRDLGESRVALREAHQRIADLAGEAEQAKADRRELDQARAALREANQQIATLTRQVARLEKSLPQGEKPAKTKMNGRGRSGTRNETTQHA
jgi:uncharacterized protein involved in exopolysaccharide biosynthesis